MENLRNEKKKMGLYEITAGKNQDRYEVEKIWDHEGLEKVSTGVVYEAVAYRIKSWISNRALSVCVCVLKM